MANNISKIVSTGLCVGCGAGGICEHIVFRQNKLGFLSPEVDDGCIGCGRRLAVCIYDSDAEGN